MNCIKLQILLHYYAMMDDYAGDDSLAEQEAFQWLEHWGLLTTTHTSATKYSITEKGQVHVKALLDSPLPESRWVSPLQRRQ